MKFYWKISMIASACVACAAPAVAQGRVSSEIRLNDLDLRTEQGIATLNHRIERAAMLICGTAGRSLFELKAVKPCIDQVTESAASAVAEARSSDASATAASVGPTPRANS